MIPVGGTLPGAGEEKDGRGFEGPGVFLEGVGVVIAAFGLRPLAYSEYDCTSGCYRPIE